MRRIGMIGVALALALLMASDDARAEDPGTTTAPSATVSGCPAPEDEVTDAADAEAEAAPDAQPPSTPEEQPAMGAARPKLEISGELKQRGEARRHHDFGTGTGEDPEFVGQLVRVQLAGAVGDFGYIVELTDGREFGAERQSGAAQSTSLLQGYLELGERVKVRLGRQEITLGSKRLIGASGWAYRQLAAYDGVRLQSDLGDHSIDAFAVKVAEGGTTARDDTTLAALSYSWKGGGAWRPGVYALFSREDALDGWLGATDMPIGGTIGALDVVPGLRLDYELIFQGGTRRGLEHRASLYHAGAKYTEPGDGGYWLGVEYNVASGDDDLSDGVSRTFDKLYSINHGKYGYIDYQDPRNLRNLRFTVGGRLSAKVAAQLDYHSFQLDQARDRWYSRKAPVTLHDPTGAAGRDVGSELDLTVKVEVRERVGVEVGYSRFFSGRFVKTLLGGGLPQPSFGYAQLRLRF